MTLALETQVLQAPTVLQRNVGAPEDGLSMY